MIVINSINRLGRNYREIQEQRRKLTKEIGADITVLDMLLLDTRQARDLIDTFIADLVLQLLSFIAENERHIISRREVEASLRPKREGRNSDVLRPYCPKNSPAFFPAGQTERSSPAKARKGVSCHFQAISIML